MNKIAPVWWRLLYADGHFVTEPREEASIRLAPRGAVGLWIVGNPDAPDGAGYASIPLRPGDRPVFYRKCSFPLNGTGEIGIDVVVYGTVCEASPQAFTGTLWCIIPGERGVNHPVQDHWIDYTAILGLYEG